MWRRRSFGTARALAGQGAVHLNAARGRKNTKCLFSELRVKHWPCHPLERRSVSGLTHRRRVCGPTATGGGSMRGLLYRLARLLGDVNAVQRGPRAAVRRAVRKAALRGFGGWLARVLG